jgi:ABC-2 type transport system permease protein
MNIRTIGLVARREFVTRVRRRAFVLGIVLAPVLLLVLMAIGYAIGTAGEQQARILVIDRAGLLTHFDSTYAAWVPNCLECFPQSDASLYSFAAETISDSAFLASDFDALVEFDGAILQHSKAMMYYEKAPSLTLTARVASHLSDAVERLKVRQEAELDYATYKRLKTDIRIVAQDIETADQDAAGRAVVGFFFSLALFMMLIVYGMHVMRGVIEEKANRIVEVIVRAVRPSELMAGKIVGIGAVGLLQFVAYALLGTAATWIGSSVLSSSGVLAPGGGVGGAPVPVDAATWLAGSEELAFLLEVNWPLMIGATVFFFIAGFALYAALFAAVGALVDQESDAQYVMLPAFLPLMASYLLAVFAMQDPEGPVAYVASFIPFTAPVLMLIRIPVGVPLHEVLLSGAGVLVTAWLCILLAGRIYRTGIFMYGKRPTFREAWRWVRRG